MNPYEYAAELLAKYEGFTPVAKWDVNAWRIGYGSDTITLPDNTFRKVKQGDRTTRELAKKDLSRRIKSFEKKVRTKIGAKYWDPLHYKVKAALISLAYNYGNIPHQELINAIRIGNNKKIARVLVDSTYNDNQSLSLKIRQALRSRRNKEAQIIASAPESSNTLKVLAPITAIIAVIFLLNRQKLY